MEKLGEGCMNIKIDTTLNWEQKNQFSTSQ